MKARFIFVAVIVLAAVSAFSQDTTTAIQPGTWQAVQGLKLQSSGKSLTFNILETGRAIRFSVVDMAGRSVWMHTTAPAAVPTSVTWNGTAADGRSLAQGVYAVQAIALGGQREKSLLRKQFIHTP
jgi:hypothetical protein